MSRFNNPVPQYLDSAGKPYVDGLIYFYLSGTNTFQDTFSDVNLSLANTNPVVLAADGRVPNIFLKSAVSNVLFTGTDSVTGLLTQVWQRDSVGADTELGNFSAWGSTVSYDVPDIVSQDGNFYLSRTNANIGNDPSTSPADWEQIDFIRGYNATVTYGINDRSVRGSDGNLYRSLGASNIGNDPVSTSGFWATVSSVDSLVAMAANDCDLSQGDYFTKTLSGDVTITFSNPPQAGSFTVRFTGVFIPTWPATVTKWKGGTVPTQGAESVYVFDTQDGGTSYTGYSVGDVAAP